MIHRGLSFNMGIISSHQKKKKNNQTLTEAHESSTAVNIKMWLYPLLFDSAGYRLLVYSHSHLYYISHFGSTPCIYYVPFKQKSSLHHVRLEFSFSANTDKTGSSSYSGKLFCCRCMSLSLTSWCSCKPEILFSSMFLLKEEPFLQWPLVFGKSQWKRLWVPFVEKLFFQMNMLITWYCKMRCYSFFWQNPL